jgi:site-specific recombinase XerD
MSIFFFLKTSKMNRKGFVPIFVRITVDGIRAEISTGQKVTPEMWNNQKARVNCNKKEAKFINERLDSLQREIQRQYNIMDSQDQQITAIALANAVSGKSVKKYTLLEVFSYHNEDFYKTIGVDHTYSTYERYLVTYKKVQKFIKYKYHQNDILLENLDYNFITSFDLFLKTHEKNQHNTATKHISNLRKIINLAVVNEWMSRNPFNKFKVTYKETNRESLTWEELERLKNKKFEIERLEKVRDVFLFVCYTGLSFSDLYKLTPQDISVDSDGRKWIIIYRHKTNTRSPIPLLDEALKIIDKYADSEETEITGRLLPVNSNQRMNGYLKEIAAVCGINKNLTMHVGRHTFATTVTLTNGIPIETVGKMLGHQSLRTTMIYAKVNDTKISKEMSRLNKQLSGRGS